jgi:hypothetical protein
VKIRLSYQYFTLLVSPALFRFLLNSPLLALLSRAMLSNSRFLFALVDKRWAVVFIAQIQCNLINDRKAC